MEKRLVGQGAEKSLTRSRDRLGLGAETGRIRSRDR